MVVGCPQPRNRPGQATTKGAHVSTRRAGRPKSSHRMMTDRGRETGISPTPTDAKRIALLSRWYSLSAEQITRFELGDFNGVMPKDSDTFRKKNYAVKRRLAKLVRVQENPGNHTGPLVGSTYSNSRKIVWYPTRYGTTLASVPWRVRPEINPHFADHAMMAADVGMQVEALGYHVYSERELASGTDRYGEEITINMESYYIARSGQQTGKKPDVAVVSRDERSFIAIEVERDTDRTTTTYVEKLKAYEDNPAVHAVWYVCESEATANRVATAADQVFGTRNFNLKIKVIGQDSDWMGVPRLTEQENMMNDLRSMG